MATLTLRRTKGLPLTNNEVDDNFTALNNAIMGHIDSLGTGHGVATITRAGFMSAADKVSLNDVVSKTNYATTTTPGVVALATTAQAIAGIATDAVLTPAALTSVLNTGIPASTIETASWVIKEVSGSLYFVRNGVNKAKLDANGNLSITGSVTSGATIV